MNLPAFPSGRESPYPRTPQLDALGLGLRHAEATDLPFLRDLYAASRGEELAGLPWPDETKRLFCDSQFDLQHRHYVAHYLSADFLVVLLRGEPVGRFYLHETAQELLIVDILLDEDVRGRGLGSALLGWTQAIVREHALALLMLHVELRNAAARRLYERHGFVAQDVEGAHLRMHWQP